MSIGMWVAVMMLFGVVEMGLAYLSLKVCERIYRPVPVLVKCRDRADHLYKGV